MFSNDNENNQSVDDLFNFLNTATDSFDDIQEGIDQSDVSNEKRKRERFESQPFCIDDNEDQGYDGACLDDSSKPIIIDESFENDLSEENYMKKKRKRRKIDYSSFHSSGEASSSSSSHVHPSVSIDSDSNTFIKEISRNQTRKSQRGSSSKRNSNLQSSRSSRHPRTSVSTSREVFGLKDKPNTRHKGKQMKSPVDDTPVGQTSSSLQLDLTTDAPEDNSENFVIDLIDSTDSIMNSDNIICLQGDNSRRESSNTRKRRKPSKKKKKGKSIAVVDAEKDHQKPLDTTANTSTMNSIDLDTPPAPRRRTREELSLRRNVRESISHDNHHHHRGNRHYYLNYPGSYFSSFMNMYSTPMYSQSRTIHPDQPNSTRPSSNHSNLNSMFNPHQSPPNVNQQNSTHSTRDEDERLARRMQMQEEIMYRMQFARQSYISRAGHPNLFHRGSHTGEAYIGTNNERRNNLSMMFIDRDFNDRDYEMLLRLDEKNQKKTVEKNELEVYSKKFTADKEEGTCSICYSEMEKGEELRELNCGHKYHKDCVDKWLKEYSNVCCICKKEIQLLDEPKEKPNKN